MYTRNSMPRRILAMVLAIAMVLSNVSVAFSDSYATGGMTFNAKTTATSDLKNLMTSGTITVNGTSYDLNTTSAITVNDTDSYSVSLAFAEGSTYEFDNNSLPWTYTLPDGVSINTTGSETQITAYATKNGTTYPVKFIVTYEGNTVKVTKDPSTTDDAWNAWTSSGSSKLDFSMNVKFNGDSGSRSWSDTVKTEVTIEEKPASLTISKSGRYNSTTHKMDYTVTVTATGKVNNVVVTDAIQNTDKTALSYPTPLTVTASPSKGSLASSTGTGFIYTIGDMTDGEKVVLTYSADVNFSALPSETGNSEYLKNSATASGKTTNNVDVTTNPSTPQITIDYTTISKSGELSSDGKTANWTITYNPECLKSVAGKTVTDTIKDTDTSILSYNGNATIKVYDANGNLVDTRTQALNSGASSFSYTIPSTDTEAYKYVITYSTTVDNSGVVGTQDVGNDVSDGNGNTGTASVRVTGSENMKIGVEKECTAVNTTDKTMSWKVTMTVPATGLTKAEM